MIKIVFKKKKKKGKKKKGVSAHNSRAKTETFRTASTVRKMTSYFEL